MLDQREKISALIITYNELDILKNVLTPLNLWMKL